MTLNGVMAVTLRYSTEFGKPALQKTICGGIYARVYCIFSACTMSSERKFTFAISSPDEFLVNILHWHHQHVTTATVTPISTPRRSNAKIINYANYVSVTTTYLIRVLKLTPNHIIYHTS